MLDEDRIFELKDVTRLEVAEMLDFVSPDSRYRVRPARVAVAKCLHGQRSALAVADFLSHLGTCVGHDFGTKALI
jgi:hypothetical protein